MSTHPYLSAIAPIQVEAMLASLPMYDLPEVRDATNAIWSSIRTRLHARIPGLPLELDRTKTRKAQMARRDTQLRGAMDKTTTASSLCAIGAEFTWENFAVQSLPLTASTHSQGITR